MPVTIETSGHVWTIIHNRPDARNAVDTAHSIALFDAFQAFDADPEARVAVFYGAGGNFCAGWDLKLAATLQDEAKRTAYFHDIDIERNLRAAMGPSRLALSKPVIGAIEGAAVAGGMELALWCDVRIMADTAYMGVFCRRWGITLVDGGTVRLPRIVGQGRALEITMTGRKVPAAECERIGLCEQVVPEGEVRATAEAMAQNIARFPQDAMRADRAAILAGQSMPVREALANEWHRGLDAISAQGTAGAGRFSAGAGRSGDFQDI
ncbi:MAG: crotonase/enoyl-CoA hydratase family protein [Pseudomonadota bacterium]